MKIKLISLATAFAALCSEGQGTFLYDQQSSFDETPPGPGPNWIALQDFPSGQSFTPALAGVDFIKLMFTDGNPNDAAGVTVHVNLRSESITGTVLGTTASLFLPNSFAGQATLYFPSDVQVVPGNTYYLNVVPETPAPFGLLGSTTYNYAGGTAFAGVFPNANADLWFREGIIAVPEPSSAALLLFAGLVFFHRHAK